MRVFIRLIETITEFISGRLQAWLLFVMMVLVLVDVTSRYAIHDPLSIAEEFGGYLLVAITCLGLAYAWKEKSHVRVDFLIGTLPLKIRRRLRLVTMILAFVFSGFIVYAAFELERYTFMFGTRSGTWVRTPIAWPQMTIIIGAVLLFLQLVVEIIKQITKLNAPDEEGE
ncbi:MAG: TRAP transporter small permease [Thermodesulfobacteriota bacterium]